MAHALQLSRSVPYLIAPVIYTYEELPLLLGPLSMKLYAGTSRTLQGLDLTVRFQEWVQRYSLLDIRRSALRALLLSGLNLRSKIVQNSFLCERSLLLSCMRAMRLAYWVVGDSFPNNYGEVLPYVLETFASIPSTSLLPLIWRILLSGEQPADVSATDILHLVEEVSSESCRRFLGITNESQLWVDIRW